MDSRITTLAHNLVHYSCSVQPKERVLIHIIGESAYPLAKALIREVYAAGAQPFLELEDSALNRELMLGCTPEQLAYTNQFELEKMKGMDAYIAVRASENIAELADVPQEKTSLYQTAGSAVLNERVNHTKWVVLRYPNNAMAQLADTSLDSFEDFYFQVCNLNYSKMSQAMDALVALMDRTDQVRLVGPGTDLRFSIKDIPAIKCDGKMNIPDGEVYTAPVRTSLNGTITYNTPSVYQGFTF